VLKFLNTKK